MIHYNGTVSMLRKTGGGLDANGDPVVAVEHWSETKPCYILANTYSNQGVTQSGSAFVPATYEIWMDYCDDFTAEQVRLFLEDGGVGFLGEFSVLRPEPMPLIGCIKISV